MEIVSIFNFHPTPIAFPYYIHAKEMAISIDIEFPYYFQLESIYYIHGMEMEISIDFEFPYYFQLGSVLFPLYGFWKKFPVIYGALKVLYYWSGVFRWQKKTSNVNDSVLQ